MNENTLYILIAAGVAGWLVFRANQEQEEGKGSETRQIERIERIYSDGSDQAVEEFLEEREAAKERWAKETDEEARERRAEAARERRAKGIGRLFTTFTGDLASVLREEAGYLTSAQREKIKNYREELEQSNFSRGAIDHLIENYKKKLLNE